MMNKQQTVDQESIPNSFYFTRNYNWQAGKLACYLENSIRTDLQVEETLGLIKRFAFCLKELFERPAKSSQVLHIYKKIDTTNKLQIIENKVTEFIAKSEDLWKGSKSLALRNNISSCEVKALKINNTV